MTRRLDPDRLRALRVERFLTQWDLALKAGVGISAVRRAEAGRTFMPYPETLQRFAKALGVAPDDLLKEEERTAPGPQ